MNIDTTNLFLVIMAILTAIFGVGRLARVITYDPFPPSIWARMTWDKITRDGPWSKLAHCHWCLGFWLMGMCVAWGYFSSLHWSWWAFYGTLALAYAASIVISYDEPE